MHVIKVYGLTPRTVMLKMEKMWIPKYRLWVSSHVVYCALSVHVASMYSMFPLSH